ncbi:MAG: hypothetical protein OXE79_00190 [Acidimicrobiaceae bacterium]|nr:hypothetical protein [Acidimicrobiaceae bacterium]MCY4176005.1 hypothetical protein [Acidimicrobiaceae bacterium]MCY4280160.1 hypothetical protein [Acidimicrobiaceae bacterium]MCY4294852.1 hypothetical protein [Acidimicrobiaceae bacterium]
MKKASPKGSKMKKDEKNTVASEAADRELTDAELEGVRGGWDWTAFDPTSAATSPPLPGDSQN